MSLCIKYLSGMSKIFWDQFHKIYWRWYSQRNHSLAVQVADDLFDTLGICEAHIVGPWIVAATKTYTAGLVRVVDEGTFGTCGITVVSSSKSGCPVCSSVSAMCHSADLSAVQTYASVASTVGKDFLIINASPELPLWTRYSTWSWPSLELCCENDKIIWMKNNTKLWSLISN